MKNAITLLASVACCTYMAAFGYLRTAEIHSDVARYCEAGEPFAYSIGIVEAEDCPLEKADTLVVYAADWCSPCRLMKPRWKSLRKQGYKVVLIDVDDPHKNDGKWEYQTQEFVNFCSLYEARQVPTMRYYNSSSGEWLDTIYTGVTRVSKIKEVLWKPSS